MIVTVTLNPAWDVTIAADRVVRGATTPVPPARRRAGGKGINVARVLAAQSVPVLAIAPVGAADVDDFAADLHGVPHVLVSCAAPTRSTYAIVEASDGVTTMITERGHPRDTGTDELIAHRVRECLSGASCLVLSGSLPPGGAADTVTSLIADASRAGVPVIADLARGYLLAAAEAGADVLKPNRDELREAVGTGDPLEGARQLQQRGAGVVVVSLGAEGLVVVPPDPSAQIWRARTSRPLAGNPTGAGDAAVAAIAGCIAAGESDPAEWARCAATWSAAAVLAPLAGELVPQHESLEHDIVLSPV